MPLLFLAILGLQRAYQWYERQPASRARRVGAFAMVTVFVIGAWFSFGLGRVYQGPAPQGPPRGTDASKYQS